MPLPTRSAFMQHLRTAVIAIVCFGLGIAFQSYYSSRMRQGSQPTVSQPAPVGRQVPPTVGGPTVNFAHEPLWAYGFDAPPAPGDKAAPQGAPSRNLRPNEDPAEQTRPRHAAGSRATYSLVDVRDGHNVIDWFPADHP